MMLNVVVLLGLTRAATDDALMATPDEARRKLAFRPRDLTASSTSSNSGHLVSGLRVHSLFVRPYLTGDMDDITSPESQEHLIRAQRR